ncbi:MAG: YggS family pyridoxal phosphate-dependent enzyme [Actinomycetota bacterium]
MTDQPSVAARLSEVRARIDRAARGAGRDPTSVRLVAVSKEVPVAAIGEAIAAGQRHFGENRAQELAHKAGAVAGVEWHFLGRLQRNKVKVMAGTVAWWHSIDRAELVTALARHAPGTRALVQVNVAGEDTKAGCRPGDAAGLVDLARNRGLDVVGLMTVPPADEDPRPHFARLAALAAACACPELSMGMTGDFEAAIAEGATMVRIGSAIFGPRPSSAGLRR